MFEFRKKKRRIRTWNKNAEYLSEGGIIYGK